VPKVSPEYLNGRRNEILDAAWSCFAQKGYHGATMQDICDEAEMSPGALYRYFKGKEEILAAINQRSQEMGRKLVASARSGQAEPLSALWEIGATFLSAFYHPEFETMNRVNLEIMPELLRDETLRGNLRDEMRFWHAAVTDILTQAHGRGELNPNIDPETAAAVFICAYDGLRQCWAVDPETFKPELLKELGKALASGMTTADYPIPTSHPTEGPPLGTRLVQKPRGQAQAVRKEKGAGGARKRTSDDGKPKHR
jgi:AcrR family transcriptional regulator